MTHFKLAPYRLSNKAAAQWADYYETGWYWLDELLYVPIEKIKFNKWNQGRYDFYIDAFQKGKAAEPVRLGKSMDGGGWYEVGDGNHRVAASLEMGYTHVPALVSREVEGKPRGVPPKDLYEEVFGRELNLVLIAVRSKIPSNSWLYLEWGGVRPDGYWFKVTDETEIPNYTQEFRVKADGDVREVDFEWRGQRMRYRGDKEGMVAKLSVMMSDVVEHKEVTRAASLLKRAGRRGARR
jgi:hypothetical protein